MIGGEPLIHGSVMKGVQITKGGQSKSIDY